MSKTLLSELRLINRSNLIHIYWIAFICITITPAINCSHSKLRELNTAQEIPQLNKGDRISIILKDQTQIKCVFLEKHNGEILIGIPENGQQMERSVDIESISKIEKLKRPPNKIMLLAVGLAALSLLILASSYVVLGQAGL